MGFRVCFARWLPKSSADAATSSKCGAPQDRADLNRRPDATEPSQRRAASFAHRTPFVEGSCEILTDREILDSAKTETGRP
jgi:hypothetical protein